MKKNVKNRVGFKMTKRTSGKGLRRWRSIKVLKREVGGGRAGAGVLEIFSEELEPRR